MTVDDMAIWFTRSSPAMALYMCDRLVLVFYKEIFQLLVISQSGEMIENAYILQSSDDILYNTKSLRIKKIFKAHSP